MEMDRTEVVPAAVGRRIRLAHVRDWALRQLARIVPTERQKLLALTVVAGGMCGLAAVAFHLGIIKAEGLMIERAMAAPGRVFVVLTILLPTAGGLLAGLALRYWVPGAVGSGIPQVKYAYAAHSGHVRLRDAFGKFVLGIMQIGSGASLGREGPTVQICAGITSQLARWAKLSQQGRRRMCPVGVAAGIAAAFNAPIAAVTFTLEEIVGDLDQTMLSGVIIAAAIAAVVERGILGQNPVFAVPHAYSLGPAITLLGYAVLGLLAAGVSLLFSGLLLALRGGFKRWTALPKWAHPAIGGAGTGALIVAGLMWLHTGGVNGGGYGLMTSALSGSLPVKVMLALCIFKLLATVFSYGSGGVGGLFAPTLFVGAMLGGAVGWLDVRMLHHPPENIGAFALVGMGAVFAGVIRAPMTSVLIIFEMTGSYGLILPLMIANMTAYVLARHYRAHSIYEDLLLQDGVVLPKKRPVVSERPDLPGEVPP